MKNYYEILEVNQTATPEIIKKVFKIHIKNNHPDLAKDEDKNNAENKMKELNEAYEILSDKVKRAEYDEALKQEKLDEANKPNEELEKIILENNSLKALLQKKEQLIEHFLSGIDLNEYNQVMEQSRVPEVPRFVSEDKINYQYQHSQNTQQLENEHMHNNFFISLLYKYRINIIKSIISLIFVILGILIINSLIGDNILKIIFDAFNSPSK
ncbi:MAG: DnaJ domain-containing protein [Clostridia bacterium]